MNIRIPFMLLLGAVTASSALAAETNAGDAQAQAAHLMTAQGSTPRTPRKVASENHARDNGRPVSAQSQAASLLQSPVMFSSPASAAASDALLSKAYSATLAHRGRFQDDAQAQARRFLRGEG